MVSAKGGWYRLDTSDVGRLGDSSSGHCGGGGAFVERLDP